MSFRDFKIPAWMKYVGGIAAFIGTLGTALAVLDIEFPRPAWAGELKAVEEYVKSVDSNITSQQLSDTKLQLYQNLREQKTYTQDSVPVPDYLLKEQTELELRTHRLEKHLNSLLQ